MKKCDLAIFVDRCFEGYQDQRPVRLIDLKEVNTKDLLNNMKESFEICRYLEDVYRQSIRPSIHLVYLFFFFLIFNSLKGMLLCLIQILSSLDMFYPRL